MYLTTQVNHADITRFSQKRLRQIFGISGGCKECQSDCGHPPGCETVGDKTKPLSPCQTTSLVLFTSGLTTQRTI